MIFVKMQRIVLHLALLLLASINYVFAECACAKCPSVTVAIICVNNRLVVTGDTISLAEVIKTAPCWSDSKQIDIFALNKVIFDSGIDERDQNVNITVSSPTWEMKPKRVNEYRTEARLIQFNPKTEFNFFGMAIEKINQDYLQFPWYQDYKQIKRKLNNDPEYEEKTLLKPTMLVSNFDEVQTMKAYVHYAQQNFERASDLSHLWKFLVELNTQYKLNDLNGLIDEFLILEKKYFSLKNDIDFIPLYDSVRSQLEHPKGQQEPQRPEQGINDLQNMFHAALISKTLAIRNHTKILSSANDTFYGMSTMKNDIARDKFQTNLNGNSEDRFRYYKTRILSEHEKMTSARIKTISEIVKNIGTRMDEIFDHHIAISEITNNKNQSKAQLIRHQLAGPLKNTQVLLSSLLHENLTAERMAQLSTKIIENFKYKTRLYKLVFDDFENIVGGYYWSLSYTFQSTKNELNTQLDEILSENNGTEKIMNLLSNKWPTLINAFNDEGNYIPSSVKPRVYKMQSLIKCSEFGMEAYNICRNDSAKLAVFAKEVDDFQNELKKWKEYEQLMYNNIASILEAVTKRSNLTDYDLFVPHLNQLHTLFGQMKGTPIYSNDLEHVIDHTIHTIKSTIELYQSNRVLKNRQSLSGLLSRIRDPIRNNDPEIQKKMETLNGITTTNIMLEICMTMAKEVLKLKTFPFYKIHSNLCELPTNTSSSDTEFVREKLLDNIDDVDDSIEGIKRKSEGANFYSHYSFGKRDPFCVWKYKDFKSEITKLLNGEEILLNANISNSCVTWLHSVKFSNVLLDFRFVNKTDEMQNDLYRRLDGIPVKMEVMGNHHQYRCDKRVYYFSMNTPPFVFKYVISSNDGHMNYRNPNAMYSKMMTKMGPILSPYTLWKTQLEQKSRGKLSKFVGEEIDLLLIGEAQGIFNDKEGHQVCNNDEINKYYQFDRVLRNLWGTE